MVNCKPESVFDSIVNRVMLNHASNVCDADGLVIGPGPGAIAVAYPPADERRTEHMVRVTAARTLATDFKGIA